MEKQTKPTSEKSSFLKWVFYFKSLSVVIFHPSFLAKALLYAAVTACFLALFPGGKSIDHFVDTGYAFPTDMLNLNSQGSQIICLGDSMTLGVGASPGHDYPSLLKNSLKTEVVNAGVDGDETEDALRRLDRDVLSKDPRLVIVLLGANDYLNAKPIDQAFKNLDEIVRRIEEKGAMVVVVEIGPSLLDRSIQKRYDRLVVDRRTAFVPLAYRNILFNPTLRSDYMHPNDKGYAMIAKKILEIVDPLLKKRPSPQDLNSHPEV